jgi:hypothetical protein
MLLERIWTVRTTFTADHTALSATNHPRSEFLLGLGPREALTQTGTTSGRQALILELLAGLRSHLSQGATTGDSPRQNHSGPMPSANSQRELREWCRWGKRRGRVLLPCPALYPLPDLAGVDS